MTNKISNLCLDPVCVNKSLLEGLVSDVPPSDPVFPLFDPELPVFDPEPPVFDPEPPVFDPEPPVFDPEPPVFEPEPPVFDPESLFDFFFDLDLEFELES